MSYLTISESELIALIETADMSYASANCQYSLHESKQGRKAYQAILKRNAIALEDLKKKKEVKACAT